VSAKNQQQKVTKKGRPLGFDPDKAMETAMNVFWEKGYDGASLDDLLQATNISKSSFYNSYGNKSNLFELCLDLFCEKQIALLEQGLKEMPNGRDFIEKFLRELVEGVRLDKPHFGCFIMNTAHEFAGRDQHISQLVSNSTLIFNKIMQRAIKNGQDAGVITKEKDPEALAYYVMSSIAGLRLMISAQVNPDQLDAIIDVTLAALD